MPRLFKWVSLTLALLIILILCIILAFYFFLPKSTDSTYSKWVPVQEQADLA